MKPQRLNPMKADLTTLINCLREVIFSSLNCHKVGKIVSFDADNQTAQAEMLVQKSVNGQIIEYPVLVDCPVFVISGGKACITLPVTAGDSCLVLFNDEDMDNWFATGSKQEANTNRHHSFTDALIMVGFRHQANKIANYSATNMQLRMGSIMVDIGEDKAEITDGSAKITLTGGNITIEGTNVKVQSSNITLEGSAVAVNGVLTINGTPYLAHTHSGVTGGQGTTGGVVS